MNHTSISHSRVQKLYQTTYVLPQVVVEACTVISEPNPLAAKIEDQTLSKDDFFSQALENTSRIRNYPLVI